MASLEVDGIYAVFDPELLKRVSAAYMRKVVRAIAALESEPSANSSEKPEWIDIPGTLKRVLKIHRTALASDFEWIGDEGQPCFALAGAALFKRQRDGKLFRTAKDRESEDCGNVLFLEEV